MVSQRHATNMEKFPGDVLSEIFVRLLAKQVGQMRCVCKAWNALLSGSSFVKSHLHRSIHHNDQILLFFQNEFSFDSVASCSSFTACPSRSPNLELTNLIKLPVNPQLKYNCRRVIGSVNGLICFHHRSYCSFPNDYVVYICNPSLSVVLTLPPCSLPSNNMKEKNHYRFGFDPKTDDYKIVKLTKISRSFIMLPEVEVYSMRRGSWELISQRFPSNITWIRDQDEVCVDGHDGHLHWLGFTDLGWKQETIVAFDLGAETFREIPLPDSTRDWCLNVLGVLGGKLCVMSGCKGGESCEVWVMDEYGMPESWVKHHAFSEFRGDIYPYGFTSRNEFLFKEDMYDGHFSLYDPVAAKTKTFKIVGRPFDITKVVEYVDSLVWVAPVECESLSFTFEEA